jgi:predicted ATPase
VLTSITLQNFKSFGEEQVIPLQPITVLVGPNNSGKSNLVSLARFIRNAATAGAESAIEQEGGVGFVLRRPAIGDACMRVGWTVDGGTEGEGTYEAELLPDATRLRVIQRDERLMGPKLGEAWKRMSGNGLDSAFQNPAGGWLGNSWRNSQPMAGIYQLVTTRDTRLDLFRPIWAPIVLSREIKLSVPALRQDAAVVPTPQLGSDGSGMAAVLGLWRGSNIERAEALDEFMRKCLPEVSRVLVKPGPVPGEQRIWVQQIDGEQFDAAHISDGVLSFIALAMHAIDVEPGALLFFEEPEQSIHPRLIHELMELFRTIAYERQCQIIVVTHSPVLLHEFRDEPDAILLFRRDEAKGTQVKPLTEFPDLMEALNSKKADPGDMLVNGFFNAPS